MKSSSFVTFSQSSPLRPSWRGGEEQKARSEPESELFNGLWPEIWTSLKRWETYMKERDPEWLEAFLSRDP